MIKAIVTGIDEPYKDVNGVAVANCTMTGSNGEVLIYADGVENIAHLRVGQPLYIALVDAESATAKVLATEDALIHEIMDLVDIPRVIGDVLVPLWQRLAHCSILTKMAGEGHIANASAAVVSVMQERGEQARQEKALAAMPSINPELAAVVDQAAALTPEPLPAIKEVSQVDSSFYSAGSLTAAVGGNDKMVPIVGED